MQTVPRLMAAAITAFDSSGEIDLDGHRHNVRTLIGRGLDGLLLAGSTGEGPYLEPGERETLVATARDELGPDAYLICGVNAESVRQAEKQTAEAAAGGADAALVTTPTTLVRGRDPLVSAFYSTVADRAPLPVMLYSVPKVTAYELPLGVVVELASHPHIVGLKDSGGDERRVSPVVRATKDDFSMYCGASRAVLASIAGGAKGAITSSANYASDLLAAAAGGNSKAQRQLTSVSAIIERGGVAETKAAAEESGLVGGPTRLPLGRLPKGS